MSADTTVRVETRAVASGVTWDAAAHRWMARVTVVLRPADGDGGLRRQDLQSWPDLMSQLLADGPLVRAAPRMSAPHADLKAHLAWSTANPAEAAVRGLWQRAMAPRDERTDNTPEAPFRSLKRALQADPAPARGASIYPTPDGAAALAFTLERGRMMLDAIAEPGAPLLAYAPARDPDWSSRRGGVQLASATASAVQLPLSPLDTLDRFRQAQNALELGEEPPPIWPKATEIAARALGLTGTLDPWIDQIRLAHETTTPILSAAIETASPPKNPVADATAQREKDTARRRLGSVLASPVLQRLFSFAVDLLCPFDDIVACADSGGFLVLATPWDPSIWTLARVEPLSMPRFYPANGDEGGAPGVQPIIAGFENLGRPAITGNDQRFMLCTVDYAFATEGDTTRTSIQQATQRAPSGAVATDGTSADAMPTLRTGGLRLIDLDVLCKFACPDNATTDFALPYHDATVLDVADRLFIGLRTGSDADGGSIHWRCPQNRVIVYEDPERKDWLEAELTRRLGPPGGRRRLELDAGILKHVTCDVPSTDASDPDAGAKRIAFSTLAAWGGDPMSMGAIGAGKLKRDGAHEWSACVVDDLDITRRIDPVTTGLLRSTNQSSLAFERADHTALSPMLRFGWPYFVVVGKVFDGGFCPALEDISPAVGAAPTVALPPLVRDGTTVTGQRYLRHERLDPPVVMIPASHWAEIAGRVPKQTGPDMMVWTALGQTPDLRSTRRLLAAPPVPLSFALQHDVMHDRDPRRSKGVPPTGLPGLTILPADEAAHVPVRVTAAPHPSFGPSLASDNPYYPDPAANLFAIALYGLGDADAPGAPLDPGGPLVIPIAAAWPGTLPIHIELVADAQNSAAARGGTLNSLGPRWLGSNDEPRASAPGVRVEAVEIRLRPGVEVIVQAWFVPSHDQLANWFDLVETAGVLAVAADSPDAGSIADGRHSCARGLARLLGIPTGETRAPAAACHGIGNMPAASDHDRTELARLLQARMLRAPLPLLSAPRVFRAIYATTAVTPVAVVNPLKVTRRLFPGDNAPTGETRLDWISGSPQQNWGDPTTETGATGALFGGTLSFDPVTTGGLAVQVTCVKPLGAPLDDPQRLANSATAYDFTTDTDGHVTFSKQTVPALQIDLIPPPADARPGMREISLETLQAAAWGTAKPFGNALRANRPAALTSPGARLMTVAVVPTSRYARFLGSAPQATRTSTTATAQLWLPATIRPAPPVVDRVQILFRHTQLRVLSIPGRNAVGAKREVCLRIWLQRPWFSSGEGERLGIVLWPPALFARGNERDDMSANISQTAALTDDDLGLGGAFVTRWGADSLERPVQAIATPLLPSNAIGPVDGDSATFVPRAYMPIAAVGSELPASDRPSAGDAPEQQAQLRTMAVALQTFVPRFDQIDQLWYVDLALVVDTLPMPRVRLGIVRYQPHAREDETPPDGDEPVRIRVSPPVVAWVQPPPPRIAQASWSATPEGTRVEVTITGPSSEPADGVVNELRPWPRAHLEVAVLQWQPGANGMPLWEQPATDDEGLPLRCDQWRHAGTEGSAAHGIIERAEDLDVWTCSFALPPIASAGPWRHAVIIKETRTFPRANATERDGIVTENTGPTYLARLELDRDAAS